MNQISLKYKIPLILLKVLIGLQFVLTLIGLFKSIYFEWQLFRDPENGIISFIRNGYILPHFRPMIILIVPTIGILINRPIGWFLIQSYLYFLFSKAIYRTVYEINHNLDSDFLLIIIAAVILPFIIFLNLKTVREFVYGIKPSKILLFNIGATVLGILITLIFEILTNR